jgi:hypothetical protein
MLASGARFCAGKIHYCCACPWLLACSGGIMGQDVFGTCTVAVIIATRTGYRMVSTICYSNSNIPSLRVIASDAHACCSMCTSETPSHAEYEYNM